MDEPTASLDPKTSLQIMRLIKELCEERGLAAIINIHDVALAQMYSERVVGLKLGEIVYVIGGAILGHGSGGIVQSRAA